MIKCANSKKESTIDKLLIRSAEFEQEVIKLLSHNSYDNSDKVRVSKIMCSVS